MGIDLYYSILIFTLISFNACLNASRISLLEHVQEVMVYALHFIDHYSSLLLEGQTMIIAIRTNLIFF